MSFERTNQIQQRFDRAIDLISKTSVNARQLALALGVSRPTVQRIVTELKRRGYQIRAVRDDNGWRYELADKSPSTRPPNRAGHSAK
ncbi:MAG: HTH domain-containing protein [Promethearchaeati archaeon]